MRRPHEANCLPSYDSAPSSAGPGGRESRGRSLCRERRTKDSHRRMGCRNFPGLHRQDRPDKRRRPARVLRSEKVPLLRTPAGNHVLLRHHRPRRRQGLVPDRAGRQRCGSLPVRGLRRYAHAPRRPSPCDRRNPEVRVARIHSPHRRSGRRWRRFGAMARLLRHRARPSPQGGILPCPRQPRAQQCAVLRLLRRHHAVLLLRLGQRPFHRVEQRYRECLDQRSGARQLLDRADPLAGRRSEEEPGGRFPVRHLPSSADHRGFAPPGRATRK